MPLQSHLDICHVEERASDGKAFRLRPAHVLSARLILPTHARLVIFLGSLASNLDRLARAGSIYTDASMITPLCQPPLQVVAIVAGRRHRPLPLAAEHHVQLRPDGGDLGHAGGMRPSIQ